MKRLSDVRLVQLPCYSEENGDLVVIEEGKSLPFVALRCFNVRAMAGAIRGHHAHKQCSQFLVCVHGSIVVDCDDGEEVRRFVLSSPSIGLLVPPSIWAAETYAADGSVLSVLCDRHYEPEDYIRDHDAFLAWRRRHDG